MISARRLNPATLFRNRRKTLTRAVGLLSCCTVLTVPVQTALADPEANLTTIEEVVVTSRKREENLQDIPVAITALSGEEMQARGMLNLADLNDTAPNFVFTSGQAVAGSGSTANVFIRGVGQSDFVVTSDPGVGIYVDGVYYARTVGATLELLDLAQVEVLRGPQGTLFGRNTIGGALNIVSKQPSFDALDGSITATGGEKNHRGARASINIPFADNVAARFAVLQRSRDGYVKALQYNNLDLGNENVKAVRGQLRWDPSDKMSITLAADYTKENDNGGAWVADYIDTVDQPFDHIFAYLSNEVRNGGNPFDGNLSPCDPAAQRTNPNCVGPVQLPSDPYSTNNTFRDVNGNLIKPFSEVKNYGTSLTATLGLGGVTLKSISAYRELDSGFTRSLNHTPFLTFQNTTDVFDTQQFSQELQLTSSADHFNWLVGAYYFTEDGREVDTVINTINLVLDGVPNGARPNDEFVVTNESLAFFGQATYSFTDTWHLTGGLRWTDEFKDGYTEADVTDGRRVRFVIDPIKETKVTPHLSLSHDFGEAVMSYVSYSKGFKTGTFSTRTPRPDLFLNADGSPGKLPVAKSESVDAYEVGVKSELWDKRARLDMAVFRTDYHDIQINGRRPGEPNIIALNAGEARIQGFEAELLALVTQNLTLRTNVGLLDGKYTNIIGDGSVRVQKDALLNRTPDYQVGIGAELNFPLSSGNVRASLDWFFVDDIALDSDNVIREGDGPVIHRARSIQKAYYHGDLGVAFSPNSEKWEIAFYIKNLTDELYRTAIVDTSAPKSDAFGVSEVMYARPREAFANFTYKF